MPTATTALMTAETTKIAKTVLRRLLILPVAATAVMAMVSLAPAPAAAEDASASSTMPQVAQASEVQTDGQISIPGSTPAVTVAPTDQRVLGNPDAPVTMVEFSSMTCPHCASFHNDTLAKLKKDFIDTGKVKLVMSDFPFDGVALRASMLARCVPPSRYFDFVDVLFKNQQRWARSRDPIATLKTFGALVGLDATAVDACLANENLQTAILTSQLEAQERYNIRSTPTFILNNDTDRIVGAEDYDVFKRKIEALLPDEDS